MRIGASVIVGLVMVLAFAGCSKSETSGGGDGGSASSSNTKMAYVDFTVDLESRAFTRNGEAPDRVELAVAKPFRGFHIKTATGQVSDIVTVPPAKDTVYEWLQMKRLAMVGDQPVILQQRFDGNDGRANPWVNILFEAEMGESGDELEALPAGVALERALLIHVYAKAGDLTVHYDAAGELTHHSCSQANKTTMGWPQEGEADSKFVAYALPTTLDLAGYQPQLNAATRRGLGSIDALDFPNEPLTGVVLAEQYQGGEIWRVRVYDARGRQQGESVRRYTPRPFDAPIAQVAPPGRR